MSNTLDEIDVVASVSIWSVRGEPASFIFKAGAKIDCDGAPNAYGPNNSGIDYTANGGDPTSGKPGAWWGGPVDKNNKAIIQKIYEPFPGFYVSATSLGNSAYPDYSQYRYIDAGSIPFIVLPGNHQNGARVGDVCLCYNEKTGDNCYGIFADVGPSSKIGEISVRMAQALKIPDDPKTGGTESKSIVYLVFPGSVGTWKPPHIWWDIANTTVSAWGGLARVKEIAEDL
jgi:Fungal chitosanase of glycosyl hydrolase group 75